jgi:hypothetical protein
MGAMDERRLEIAWKLAEAASLALDSDGRDLEALRQALWSWRELEIEAVFSHMSMASTTKGAVTISSPRLNWKNIL